MTYATEAERRAAHLASGCSRQARYAASLSEERQQAIRTREATRQRVKRAYWQQCHLRSPTRNVRCRAGDHEFLGLPTPDYEPLAHPQKTSATPHPLRSEEAPQKQTPTEAKPEPEPIRETLPASNPRADFLKALQSLAWSTNPKNKREPKPVVPTSALPEALDAVLAQFQAPHDPRQCFRRDRPTMGVQKLLEVLNVFDLSRRKLFKLACELAHLFGQRHAILLAHTLLRNVVEDPGVRSPAAVAIHRAHHLIAGGKRNWPTLRAG